MDMGMAARYLNIIAGAWLFISAFLWQHSDSSQTNSWIVGATVMVFAAIALLVPAVRFLNTALSVWLVFSTLSIFHLTGATLWNNLIVAAIIFIVSLVPRHAAGPGHRPRRYAAA
jgi:hypothetical protein